MTIWFCAASGGLSGFLEVDNEEKLQGNLLLQTFGIEIEMAGSMIRFSFQSMFEYRTKFYPLRVREKRQSRSLKQ